MAQLPPKVTSAVIVATVTVLLDWIFHRTLTSPMETFDYFTVKWLLAFFVATVFLSWAAGEQGRTGKRLRLISFAAVFSFLMSLYYRWWEYFSGAPYSARAPDILFLERANVVMFAGTWFLAHALFFLAGVWLAKLFVRESWA